MKAPVILLIEDDPDNQELIRICLSDCNLKHELVAIGDGEEAFDFITSMKEKSIAPALILLDLKLPKVNGHELLKKFREEQATKHLPVVIFTSSKEEKDIKESYALGANAFVRKPIEFTEFREVVKDIGNFWLKHNEINVLT